MKITAHLYVGQNRSVRVTKGHGMVRSDEIAFELQLDIPDAFFRRPHPVIAISVPPPDEVPIEAVLSRTAETVGKAMHISVEHVEDGLRHALDLEAASTDKEIT